ncbi:MAG: hypothetical protein K0Q57_665, partial [Gammaproteobacteria bacterium]|nr:hypothetical protein [Gammaproteobacteria bacterium]
AFQACCSARQPEGYSTLYEPSSKQNKIYILEQTHSVLQQVKVNDEASFKKAIEVSPFFTQLNVTAGATANADTSAGTELELGAVGGSIN